ncbi:piwi domain-containing protein [Ditylenchus destructor]|uniref:Piwi domain-containing protein n=1 Tax=Ditylenchus destructor TaxID=166010 RepID=A0AAD4QVH0_9BILA|nr:piwi domain-containing protein [Ditylenchus destructor]
MQRNPPPGFAGFSPNRNTHFSQRQSPGGSRSPTQGNNFNGGHGQNQNRGGGFYQQRGDRPGFHGSQAHQTAQQMQSQEVRRENGVCSLFTIEVKPGSKAYRYDVDIIISSNSKSLTKASDSGQRALNRALCYEIMSKAYGLTRAFGMEPNSEVVYDNRCTMYTSSPIDLPKNQIPVSRNLVSEFIKRYVKEPDFIVSLVQNNTGHVIDLCDLSQYITKASLLQEDRSLRTFLELATNQYAINTKRYIAYNGGKLFEVSNENDELVGNGMVLKSGVVKGVRVVENHGQPTPALVLDAKVCPHFVKQSLAQTCVELNYRKTPQPADYPRLLKTLQDVRVEVMYAPHRSFGIGQFSQKPISQMKAVYKGQTIPMVEFFKLHYKVDLRHPNLPGVIPNTPRQQGKPIEVFPMEQLMVMPGQIVPLEKMPKGLSDKLLKVNSIFPRERINKIMRHANMLAVFDTRNAVLHAFGITVSPTSNEVVIGVRPCPRIRYGNDQIVNPDPNKANWQREGCQKQYIHGSNVTNWLLLCSQDREQLVRQFVEQFMRMAHRKGVNFSPPIIRTFRPGGTEWGEVFTKCINSNIEFVMLIDGKDVDSHGLLKYYEARYKIITQHVTIERVTVVVQEHKNQILENILNKTNCKNFGLNYEPVMEACALPLDLNLNEILVIGYDVAHPGPVTAQERRILRVNGLTADSMDPSVVGICANMAKHPYAFVGDYFYQESRKEAVDTLQLSERVKWILTTLRKNRGSVMQKPPKHMFVLRDGLSEGQFAMAIEIELEAIRKGCQMACSSYKPEITFVIGTKRHFKRFFAMRDGRVENLAPGSVITEKFVRADCPEFFMQSHFPLKIVNMAVSLPEPVYQADELAKRGRNNYLTMKKVEPQAMPRLESRLIDHRKLTEQISYMNNRLCGTRFSA